MNADNRVAPLLLPSAADIRNGVEEGHVGAADGRVAHAGEEGHLSHEHGI